MPQLLVVSVDRCQLPVANSFAFSSCKTIDNQAVGLAKIGDLSGVKGSRQIRLSEGGPVKEVKDEADMPGVSCVVQPLHFFYSLFRQLRRLAVNRRAATAAFPYGIKLAATEWTNVVNETGLVFL